VRGQNEIDSIALNVDYMPCNSTASDYCAPNMTLTDLKDYLSHPELVILSNQ